MLQVSSCDPIYSPSDPTDSPICLLPKEARQELYTNLHLPSVGRMCCVSKKFNDEITEFIFIPTMLANKLSSHVSDLDELLKLTKSCGKQVKWLNLSLEIERKDKPLFEKMTEQEAANALAAVDKVLAILQNCPNLAVFSLEYGLDGMDNNKLFEEVNANILPKLPMLEELSFKDTIRIGWPVNREFKEVKRLNINSLSRLHKLSLENFDFNKEVLAQIKRLPENIDIQLNLSCRGPISGYIIDEFKNNKPNYKILWDLTAGNVSYPEDNLRALQEVGCHQEVFIQFANQQPTDEAIALLKPFKKVTLIELMPQGTLEEQVERLLPEQNVILPTVRYVNANLGCEEEQDSAEAPLDNI